MDRLKKLINRETIYYLIFGVLTTIVDFSIYFILTHVSVNYLIANTISWCIAFIFAFVTNKLIVFRSKKTDFITMMNEFTGFLGARLFSLLFSLVFMYLTVTLFGMNDFLAKVIASIFVVIINYVFSKLFIFNTKKESQKSTGSFLADNFSFIVAFLIPLILLMIIYHIRKIYPFGDNMYLRSDCYHQYAPFMMEFYNKIKNGGNFTYSWNIGMGVNFSALYAYYLASPVNWFIGLVKPSHIPEIMSVFIIVKTSLSSSTFAYYLSKHFNTKKATIAALSVFYALSSYFCAYSWNLMWIDCFVLLPLIILGLEKLVKENKCYLYCISLGIAILSNYYIAIMICIFCVIYFIGLIYADENTKTISYYTTRFKNFVLYSLLAGGFAAVTFLPAYFSLASTASGEFEFPKTIITYFSVLFMFSRALINVEPAVFSAHDPNIYCGVIVFLLIPLYIINPKIKTKEKIVKVSIVCFLLYSFNTNVPNYIWHGFHYPNSLPCRESFLYIFMVLSMGYEALIYIREVTRKQLYSCFAGVIALILIIEQLFVSDTYSASTIYISIAFLIFYMIVFSLFRNNNYKQGFVAYLLIIMVTAEAYINTDETALSTCTRSAYLDDNNAIASLVDKANKKENVSSDSVFFRIEKEDRRSKNDAAWSNYHGASIFSSTTNAALSKYYGALGFEESTNAYAYYGHTPLTAAMFSIKYVLSTNVIPETDYTHLFETEPFTKSSGAESNYYMYENDYWLPLGFMLPADMEENWDITNPNPFAVQNEMVGRILGIDSEEHPMYTRLMVNTIGDDNEVYLESDTHLFIYVTTSLDRIKVDKTLPDGTSTTKNYYSMTHSHMLDLGELETGTKVVVYSADPDVSSIQIYAYSFDKDIFLETFEKLNESAMDITKITDTHVEATVNAKNSGLLYTSIPYDEGWTVNVDGRKVATHGFKDALLSFYLDQGEHTITFDYSPKGLKAGISITIVSILVFIAILTADLMKQKRKRHTDDEE
ncbi:MAG: YfhO family protein [Lachnospiraceae bacterium]|nr:YfhO family protein [Lachnospiraceae bacterium]